MIKWTKVDKYTRKPVSPKGGHTFEPHDYMADDEHLNIMIINDSFSRRKGGWALAMRDGMEVARFDTLKAAKAYAEANF